MTDDTPFARFARWLAEAEQSEPSNPSAMSVATVDAQGRPQVRMVLLRGFDARGFVFYTNLESHKGADLKLHPYAALCFYWKSRGRQVRIDGPVEIVSDTDADAYFASRPRESQIGAWASQQSRRLESRLVLEQQVARYAAQFGAKQVPRPRFWSGYRVIPEAIEFWEERPFRLHERTVFTRDEAGWESSQLYP